MEHLPNELKSKIKDYIIFKPKTKKELQKAVDLWYEDEEEALNNYCHISYWDTSLIHDMKRLFLNKIDFNDNINKWNVSKVEDMDSMFENCKNFNQPLNKWNVSKVEDMAYMFENCENFNQPLNNWDVSNVTDMNGMFWGAYSFNQSINSWEVLSENDIVDYRTHTYCMFKKAESFDKKNALWYDFN